MFRYLVKAGPGGASVGEIQQALGIPLSTLSHHLSRMARWPDRSDPARQGDPVRAELRASGRAVGGVPPARVLCGSWRYGGIAGSAG
ncbi:MAG: helix-turn-helix domain-containing protein [Chromatiales bacterium]|nr:helix-turn-helix domain-containing protein [Chromatiales bacterium]MCK7582215.1 helix-turn-helix domain-containing protein [Chromatiales bacterium]